MTEQGSGDMYVCIYVCKHLCMFVRTYVCVCMYVRLTRGRVFCMTEQGSGDMYVVFMYVCKLGPK